MERIELEQKKIMNCKAVFPVGVDVYEVKEKYTSVKVHMGMHSCTCRRWDMSGIPCPHALKVISRKKLNQEDFISSCYLTSRWRNQYNERIKAVCGLNFWEKSGEIELMPPPKDATKGGNKIPKRIKGRNESPQKKKRKEKRKEKEKEIKVTREGRIVHCGKCGKAGHNIRRCKWKNSDRCEGPSQPTQSQVID